MWTIDMYIAQRIVRRIAFAYPAKTTSDKPKPAQAKIDNALSEIPNQKSVGTRNMPAVCEPSWA